MVVAGVALVMLAYRRGSGGESHAPEGAVDGSAPSGSLPRRSG
jgi:hypothetical protein